MKKIKTYSKKFLHLKQNIWNFNIISIARAFNSPINTYISFDDFNYEFEKNHNLQKAHIAEESENYSYY